MGSAFPNDGLGSPETVLFLAWEGEDDSLICHAFHVECDIQYPHRMSECGRFNAVSEAREP